MPSSALVVCRHAIHMPVNFTTMSSLLRSLALMSTLPFPTMSLFTLHYYHYIIFLFLRHSACRHHMPLSVTTIVTIVVITGPQHVAISVVVRAGFTDTAIPLDFSTLIITSLFARTKALLFIEWRRLVYSAVMRCITEYQLRNAACHINRHRLKKAATLLCPHNVACRHATLAFSLLTLMPLIIFVVVFAAGCHTEYCRRLAWHIYASWAVVVGTPRRYKMPWRRWREAPPSRH